MFGLLPPSSSVTRLSVAAALGADLAPDLGRAGERDLVDARVVDQRGAGLAVAGQHVDDPVGKPASWASSPSRSAVSGVCSAGLRTIGAAGRERRGELPRRHQQREVPRDDLGADADRLAARVAEHVAGRDRDRLALDLGRPAGVVAQVVDGRRDVALRGRDRLAVVERLELGELGAVGLDQLGERVDQPRRASPG